MCSHQHISLKPTEWYNEVLCKTLHFPAGELQQWLVSFSLVLWRQMVSFGTVPSYLQWLSHRCQDSEGTGTDFCPFFFLLCFFFSLSEQEWSLTGHENGIFFSLLFLIPFAKELGVRKNSTSCRGVLGRRMPIAFLSSPSCTEAGWSAFQS